MKYSIIAQPWENQGMFQEGKKFCRVFSDSHCTAIVAVDQNEKLKLQVLTKEKGEAEQGVDKNGSKIISVAITEQIEWKKLKTVWCGSDQCILIFEKPFRMYFVLGKYQSIIPIKLEQDIELNDICSYVSYPDLFLYGHDQKGFKNLVYTVNLQTFQIKEVTSTKDYSPKGRIGYWSFFSDYRLYVAGGVDKNGKQVDPLLWTFNIENGYWFALELLHEKVALPRKSLSCQFENGKVLVVGQGNICIVELYQSQVKDVEGWRELISQEELDQVESIFAFEGWIYFVKSELIFSKRFKISKVKTI